MVVGLVLLAGCTPEPGGERPPTAAPPVTAFATLAGQPGPGASDAVEAAAAAGNDVVAVGRVDSWRSLPTFRLSRDGGQSWQEGSLLPDALAATPLPSYELPQVVVHGSGAHARWVALGAESRAVAWTSADGLVWDRTELPREVADPDLDDVSGIAAGDGGFVAVGSRTVGGHDSPVVWTSPDGRSWERHDLGGRGWLSSVAVRGRTAVAVGASHIPGDARAWRSVDLGRTWSAVRVPRPPHDDDFSRALRSVSASGVGFVALGQAAIDDGWRPTLYVSTDGSRWTYDASARGLARDPDAYGSALPPDDDGVVATERLATFRTTRLWRRAGRGWISATTPADDVKARVNDMPTAVVRTASGWVVVVEEEDNGRTRGRLWFSADGYRFADTEVPASRHAQAADRPESLVLAGGRTYAVGASAGRPAVWTVGSPGAPAPGVVLENDTRFDEDGATGRAGQLLVWGSDLGGNSRFATVWTSPDGRRFTRTRAGTFGRTTTFGYSDINQVRRLGSRWVAVGEQSTNGPAARSALIATSADGTSWTPARPGPGRTTDDETGDEVTALLGAGGHVRAAYDVVVSGSRTLVVGEAAESGEVQPAVWRARTSHGRETWSLQRLPLRGYDSATMTRAAGHDAEVVVLGTARPHGSTVDVLYVWVSEDHGDHWSSAPLPLGGVDAAHLGRGGLVRVDGAYVVSATLTDDHGQPLAWRSGDARSWEPLPLQTLPGTAADDRSVVDLTSDGGAVVGLVRVRDEQGSGTSVFRQEIG